MIVFKKDHPLHDLKQMDEYIERKKREKQRQEDFEKSDINLLSNTKLYNTKPIIYL